MLTGCTNCSSKYLRADLKMLAQENAIWKGMLCSISNFEGGEILNFDQIWYWRNCESIEMLIWNYPLHVLLKLITSWKTISFSVFVGRSSISTWAQVLGIPLHRIYQYFLIKIKKGLEAVRLHWGLILSWEAPSPKASWPKSFAPFKRPNRIIHIRPNS